MILLAGPGFVYPLQPTENHRKGQDIERCWDPISE